MVSVLRALDQAAPVASTAVKPRVGYVPSEIGPIPDSWETVPLGEVLEFQNGVNADAKAYGSGVRFANVLEVITHSHLTSADIPGRVQLTPSLARAYRVRRGDVLFNRTSETQEEVALSSVYVDDQDVVFGGFVIRGRPTSTAFDPVYCGYAWRERSVRSQIIARGQGAIRANIGQSDLRTVFVPKPPAREQKAIAEALSNADLLINAVGQLIRKMREIKKGTAERLLTGQERLAGFTGEWSKLELGDLLSFKNGLNKAKNFFGFGTPIVNYMDVFNSPRILSNNLVGRVSLSQSELRNFDVRRGDVFFTRTSETQDEIGMAAVFVDEPNQTTFSGFVLRGRPKNDLLVPDFAACCLRSESVRRQIISKASYTTRALTNGRILSAVKLLLPEQREQKAIASVLADIDDEISALDRKLAKARRIKQGMMQELLTGRVRLL